MACQVWQSCILLYHLVYHGDVKFQNAFAVIEYLETFQPLLLRLVEHQPWDKISLNSTYHLFEISWTYLQALQQDGSRTQNRNQCLHRILELVELGEFHQSRKKLWSFTHKALCFLFEVNFGHIQGQRAKSLGCGVIYLHINTFENGLLDFVEWVQINRSFDLVWIYPFDDLLARNIPYFDQPRYYVKTRQNDLLTILSCDLHFLANSEVKWDGPVKCCQSFLLFVNYLREPLEQLEIEFSRRGGARSWLTP